MRKWVRSILDGHSSFREPIKTVGVRKIVSPTIVGDHALIPLSQGKFAIVDASDVSRVLEVGWFARKSASGTYYAQGRHGRKQIQLHRFILGVTDLAVEIDHVDGDGLNCRRYNLRQATDAQNGMNRRPNNGIRFKGVRPSRKHWKACIGFKGKYLHIGVYNSPEDAARAYDQKAKELFGEFAWLNFPADPMIASRRATAILK